MNVELHPSLSSSGLCSAVLPLLVLFSGFCGILNFDLDIQFIDKFT